MVIKFNPEGRVIFALGRKPEASDEGAHPLEHPDPPLPAVNGLFRQVTDMAWDPQGNTYISDGYINSRVAKYDKDGNWVMQWGDRGTEPGKMNTPTIAADAQGNIYVGDRGDQRIQVFNGTGQLQRIISIDVDAPAGSQPLIGNMPNLNAPVKTQSPGAPWVLCIAGTGHTISLCLGRVPRSHYKLSLDGKLLGAMGGGGRTQGKFGWIHGIACPSENTLFVGELLKLARAEADAPSGTGPSGFGPVKGLHVRARADSLAPWLFLERRVAAIADAVSKAGIGLGAGAGGRWIVG